MKRILVIFGTRPEAIKMCPLVLELKSREEFETIVCVSGQHRQMLDQVLDVFGIVPDHDLSIMKPRQTLNDLTTNILTRLKKVLELENPDLVLVHGDTTTTFAASLTCFYENIPVGHVEAGLRTFDIHSPFPEEFNRRAVSLVADLHFAPTATARENLLREGVDPARVFVTGNTAIDALRTTISPDFEHDVLDWVGDSKMILITAHRRENQGEPMDHMFQALAQILQERPELKAVYPIHLNPDIRATADRILGHLDNLLLIPPLDVLEFHNIMARAYVVMTDSGGIQEEAPALGIPVLVMRNTTERPEGIESGTLKLVGTQIEEITTALYQLLDDQAEYDRMSQARNPYGDGTASRQIAQILSETMNR